MPDLNVRIAALVVTVVLGVVPIACAGAPDLVIVNRSGRPIAFLPGVVVPPCNSVELTREQITHGNAEADRWFGDEAEPYGWVPPDAVHYRRGLMGAPIGAPDPMTLVISSEAEPQVVHGFPADLPPCGGEPMDID